MKIQILIIFAIITYTSILMYADFTYAQGGSINLDPDLSPSYASYEQQIFNNPNSIFVAVPILLGIISLLLIIPHLILKKKKISSRPYIVLISAAIMLFIGIPNFIQAIMILFILLINKHLWTGEYLLATVPFMILGFILVAGGIILLAKSKLLQNFIWKK
ncbi:hypothetical protein [Nitrosarchaeum sp. AC2]|uniref:hypothetical protein n=1 Tax=Nitrosarchaeum sp. AC2 TaxID=2259673 RepID=UPI0015CA855D|nr:hypothetical protein [Nitrosarchaeum sp. AC2]